MSVEAWPVRGSTAPLGLRRFGSKKSCARSMGAPPVTSMLAPLLSWRWIWLLSRLWPKRKATVENSVAIAGSTLGL